MTEMMTGFEDFQTLVDNDPRSEIDYLSTAYRGELGAVEAFCEFARGKLLFDVDTGGWHYLDDDMLWKPDPTKAKACQLTGLVWDDLHQYIAANLKGEGNPTGIITEEQQEYLYKWGNKLNSHSGREAILRMAKGAPHMWVDNRKWDYNPYLLHCRNGALDIKTGEFREPVPEDFLTKRASVSYEPEAGTGTLWKQVLREVFEGDQEIVDYLQMALGYTILGLPNGEFEQKFFLCYGPKGGNGKNTVFDPICEVLGTYAGTAGANTFNYTQNNIPEDLHQLRSTRMILASEPSKRDSMDEEMVKAITGNREVRTRMLHQNSTTWVPRFAVWMLANHYPRVPNSQSLFRRFVVFPFNHQFTGDERKFGLARKLIDEEGPAILNWMVEGAYKWLESNLETPPDKCQAAWGDFYESTDVLRAFIVEDLRPCGETEEGAIASEVYQRYRTFCQLNGYYPLGRNRFYSELIAYGAEVDNGRRGKVFLNLMLKDSAAGSGLF